MKDYESSHTSHESLLVVDSFVSRTNALIIQLLLTQFLVLIIYSILVNTLHIKLSLQINCVFVTSISC